MVYRKRMATLVGWVGSKLGVAIEKSRDPEFFSKKDNRKCLRERGMWDKGVTSAFCVSCLMGDVVLYRGVAIVKSGASGGKRWEPGPWRAWWILRKVVEGGVQQARTEWIQG